MLERTRKMFGHFKKRTNSHQEGLREDFDKLMSSLNRGNPTVRMVVGHSINIVNTAFVARFGRLDTFRNLPKDEKLKYIASLTKAEELASKDHPEASVAFVLFKMWIAALTESDDELFSHFSKGIAVLSREGDLGA